MTIEPQVLAAVSVAGFLIGFNKAAVAGTLGPFVTVLVALTMPADVAIGLLLPMLIFTDWLTVAAHWRKWDLTVLKPLVVAATLSVAVSSFLISSISETLLRRLIAASVLAFVVWFLIRKRIGVMPVASKRFAWFAGAASGFTSTIAHVGGPPIVAYMMAARVPARTMVSTTAIFFAVVNLLKVPGYAAADLFDWDLIIGTLWAWVTIPAGVLIGRLVVNRINQRLFEQVTLILLAIGGVLLLVT